MSTTKSSEKKVRKEAEPRVVKSLPMRLSLHNKLARAAKKANKPLIVFVRDAAEAAADELLRSAA